MNDNKTQESKKTVVAFVAGLIIGGLLVWMFSGAPKESTTDNALTDNKSNVSLDKQTDGAQVTGGNNKDQTATASTTAVPDKGNFTFLVANQPAGAVVLLGKDMKYPTKEGWIAVQDEMNGKLGNVLGASRYDTEVGLTPHSVELLRSTKTGKTYHVVYYTESGDRIFSRVDDAPMKATGGGIIETTFVAE